MEYSHILIDSNFKGNHNLAIKVEFSTQGKISEKDIDWEEIRKVCCIKNMVIHKLNIETQGASKA